MVDLRPGEVVFTVHGPEVGDDGVSASVFASKLTTLVRALKAADKAVNGHLAHDYSIARLHNSSPTVVLKERLSPHIVPSSPQASGINAFERCAQAVKLADPIALEFGQCTAQIQRLSTGAREGYGYAEVWTGKDNVIRIDSFLKERAAAVLRPKPFPEEAPQSWFKGAVYGSFDGILQVVDLRGNLPEIKLTLSAGGKQIDCVCRKDDVEVIGATLNKRVRVFGNAIYDGKSGLPRRVEVTEIQPIGEPGDFTRWRGSFEPFTASDWPEEAN